ncbi:hypothetical protein MKQ68_11210 [Chitinophaga horti]|uniref:Uncharacterized protein n=1 Tax=Chitinophaga horti TaxID=2920382 RepID=A0ABY6J8L6_9BACT|nr:hypothetical protein [Chitinophaga horti]UYQ95671.1 hypothetical protein MKQ68_11210 [Chitinophaga horti]
MDAQIQAKIDEIKRQSERCKAEGRFPTSPTFTPKKDSLSMAIRTKKDADIFMAEIDAIRKKKN